jgi:hypothetical protein
VKACDNKRMSINPECTFRPKIIIPLKSDRINGSVDRSLDVPVVEVGFRLHEKKTKSYKSNGKTKDQVDFEKFANEMTFKPKIMKKSTPHRVSLTASLPSARLIIEDENYRIR